MSKLKYALSGGALTAAMLLGNSAAAFAQTTNNGPASGNAVTISGNCSGAFLTAMSQDQDQDVDSNPVNILDDSPLSNITQTITNDQNQSQTYQLTFSPDCSVTNVTKQVAKAEPKVAQVAAPKGGVAAGAGSTAASAMVPALGLGGSLSALGYGLLRRNG